MKEQAVKARKAKRTCNFFEWLTALTGIVIIGMLIGAALTPPPWSIDSSMFEFANKLLAVMGIFAALQAFKYGHDARIAVGNMTISFDGNGDGKVEA